MRDDELNVYQLAQIAECGDPDKAGGENEDPSPGASFLMCIRDSCFDYFDSRYTDDPHEAAHEIADSCIPVYTGNLWATFLDLAAYNENPNEMGEVDDMTKGATTCLYLIGLRLAHHILENYEPMVGLGGFEWTPGED